MKKILSVLLLSCMIAVMLVPFAFPVSANTAVTSTFDSTAENPTISTAEDYIAFFREVYDYKMDFAGKTITMLYDVTLNDTTVADWYTKADAVKLVGSDGWAWFKGTFDGGNHTLEGAIVEGVFRSDAPIGLFPYAGYGASIKNLTVDGFYVCSPNTTNDPAYGHAGIGGLVGHAKENLTIDNVTMKNGIVTCVSDGKGGLGAVVGAYDGQTANQQLKITNTTVEQSVKVIGGNDTVYVGGIIGYVHENYLSHPTTIDLSASRFQPYGSMDENITLKPVGSFRSGGDPSPGLEWKLINKSTNYSKSMTMDGGKDYTEAWNTEIIASACYGSQYIDLATYTITWIVDGVQTTEEYSQGATPSYK